MRGTPWRRKGPLMTAPWSSSAGPVAPETSEGLRSVRVCVCGCVCVFSMCGGQVLYIYVCVCVCLFVLYEWGAGISMRVCVCVCVCLFVCVGGRYLYVCVCVSGYSVQTKLRPPSSRVT